MTGGRLDSYPNEVHERTISINGLVETYRTDKSKKPKKNPGIPPKNLPKDDNFIRLWKGDFSGYASQSEADLALLSRLAPLTGGDRGQMEQLFSQSGLYREKWDREDYRRMTIDKALDGWTNTHEPLNHDDGISWEDVRKYFVDAKSQKDGITHKKAIYQASRMKPGDHIL